MCYPRAQFRINADTHTHTQTLQWYNGLNTLSYAELKKSEPDVFVVSHLSREANVLEDTFVETCVITAPTLDKTATKHSRSCMENSRQQLHGDTINNLALNENTLQALLFPGSCFKYHFYSIWSNTFTLERLVYLQKQAVWRQLFVVYHELWDSSLIANQCTHTHTRTHTVTHTQRHIHTNTQLHTAWWPPKQTPSC